jgi:hypothetical protein
LVYVDCGISATGWVTFTVPNFDAPSNYYIAIWRNNNQNFSGQQNVTFKGRYGCGDAPVQLCILETDGVSTLCNGNGTYSVILDVIGTNGTYVGVDNTGTPGVTFQYAPNPLTLTNLGASSPVTSGTVTATYPTGTAYNFTVYEATGSPQNSSGLNDSNNACRVTVSGASPGCCGLNITEVAVVPETYDGAADGSITVTATTNSGNTIEYSLNGSSWQLSNVFTGLSDGQFTVYAREVQSPSCADQVTHIVSELAEVCVGETSALIVDGYEGRLPID